MTTREKILHTALKLFNDKGLSQVSIRDIAAEMGISDGNLRYHFKTRDKLIEALFDQLVDKIGHELFSSVNVTPHAGMIRHMLAYLMQGFYDYRFMMQDFVSIVQQYPYIRTRFKKITEERLLIIDQVMDAYVQLGYFIPDPYPGHYKKFVESTLIISHFWINGAQLFYHGKKKDVVHYYTDLIFNLMYPYLTPKAIKELNEAGISFK